MDLLRPCVDPIAPHLARERATRHQRRAKGKYHEIPATSRTLIAHLRTTPMPKRWRCQGPAGRWKLLNCHQIAAIRQWTMKTRSKQRRALGRLGLTRNRDNQVFWNAAGARPRGGLGALTWSPSEPLPPQPIQDKIANKNSRDVYRTFDVTRAHNSRVMFTGRRSLTGPTGAGRAVAGRGQDARGTWEYAGHPASES